MLKLKPFRETPGLCGPASLKIVMDYYGVSVSEAEIAKIADTSKEKGTSVEDLIKTAKHFGFKTFLKQNSSLVDIRYFIKSKIPVIVDWFTRGRNDYPDSETADGHYSVVTDLDDKFIYLQDPEIGRIRKIKRYDFMRVWFDFPGDYIKKLKDLVLRLMLVVTPFNAARPKLSTGRF